MTTLTVSDLISQLSQANPDARVVFKIECEDAGQDAKLEFSRVIAISPATQVEFRFADNTEDLRVKCSQWEGEAGDAESKWETQHKKINHLKERATEEVWTATQILNALDSI